MILGTVSGGVEEVRSWKVGSGALADELISSDPPSAAEIRRIRDRIEDIFEGVEIEQPAQAVAVGGSATSLRRLVGAVLEYETLERGVRVLAGEPAADVARRFELDPERVRILTTGVLLLEKVSELLGQPLQIGKGGLREGVILDLLNGNANGSRRPPGRLIPPNSGLFSSLLAWLVRAKVQDLDCDAPFAEAAARVIEVRAEEVFEQSRGVLDLGEIERVHDMRVATRRLRAAMEIFEPCFPRKRLAQGAEAGEGARRCARRAPRPRRRDRVPRSIRR